MRFYGGADDFNESSAVRGRQESSRIEQLDENLEASRNETKGRKGIFGFGRGGGRNKKFLSHIVIWRVEAMPLKDFIVENN